MDGMLTGEEFEQVFNMALEGCKQINQMQKEALRKKYVVAKEEGEKEEAEAKDKEEESEE
jgi:exosome complex component RRP41